MEKKKVTVPVCDHDRRRIEPKVEDRARIKMMDRSDIWIRTTRIEKKIVTVHVCDHDRRGIERKVEIDERWRSSGERLTRRYDSRFKLLM